MQYLANVFVAVAFLVAPVLAVVGSQQTGGAEAITPDVLTVAAGVVLSLAFSYIPGLRAKFAQLQPEVKQLVMVGILAAVSAGIYGLACTGYLTGIFGLAVACGQSGWVPLLRAFILAVISNQSTYMISPQPADVQKAKQQRDADLGSMMGRG